MAEKQKSDKHSRAVALSYDEGASAPKVVAKGKGQLAEAIIAKAREAGVYVHESPALVAMLMQLDLDEQIPPNLYRAVAELLAWVYRLEQGMINSDEPLKLNLPPVSEEEVSENSSQDKQKKE